MEDPALNATPVFLASEMLRKYFNPIELVFGTIKTNLRHLYGNTISCREYRARDEDELKHDLESACFDFRNADSTGYFRERATKRGFHKTYPRINTFFSRIKLKMESNWNALVETWKNSNDDEKNRIFEMLAQTLKSTSQGHREPPREIDWEGRQVMENSSSVIEMLKNLRNLEIHKKNHC